MILLALIATCVLEKSDTWGPDGKLPLRAETVVSGLEVPWSFAFLPGEDVLVSERPGRVRLSPHWCVTEEELERGMDLVIQHLGVPLPS